MPFSPLGRGVSHLAAFQSAFSTLAAGPWRPVSLYTSGASERKPFVDDPLLGRSGHNQRDPQSSAPALPSADGPVQAALCLREIGIWLKATFGQPVTTGASPNFTHVFKSGADTVPALTLHKVIAAADRRNLLGVKVNSFAVRGEKTDGFPRVDLGLMLRSEAPVTAAPSGTIDAAYVLERPAAARAFARWGGVAIGTCQAAALTYTNNFEALQFLGGDEYPGDLDPGASSVSGNLTLRYQDPTFENLAIAETYGLLELGWTMPTNGANRQILFAMPRTKLARNGTPVTGPGAIVSDFQFSAEQGGSEAAVVVTLKNDVPSY